MFSGWWECLGGGGWGATYTESRVIKPLKTPYSELVLLRALQASAVPFLQDEVNPVTTSEPIWSPM